MISGCAGPMTNSILYPESASVSVRMDNQNKFDGMVYGLQWKLKPREVVEAKPRSTKNQDDSTFPRPAGDELFSHPSKP